ncbi:WXG100-like domain-containing protein [Nocardia xishanensis]
MIEIPQDLKWLGWLVGVDLPEGNEDLLFAIGDAWIQAAKAIAAQVDPLTQVRRRASGAYRDGAGAETISALFTDLLDGDSSLAALASSYDELGSAAFDFGTTVQAAKLTMIVSYVLLAAEIIWAWMFPPTAPAVEAAAVAGTRSALRRVEDLVITRIEQMILRAFGTVGQQAWTKLVVKNLATYAVKGAVSGGQSVLVDATIQGGQIAAGTRRDFNGNQALLSFGASFAGGLFGRPAAHWGGIGFDASIGRLTNRLGRAADVGRGAAIGAFAGAVGTIGGSMATAMNSGDWQGAFTASGFGLGASGGAFRGSVAGGARGLFHLNRTPGSAARTGFLRHFQLDAEGNVYLPASRAAAVGESVTDRPIERPAPVARPSVDRSVESTPRHQRRLRELDRQDAANLREYHRQVRAAQPQLQAQPPEHIENQPRARALGAPDGTESADRQPRWASRMADRAQAMQDRADAAQLSADRAQAGADAVQRRATMQQVRATTEDNAAVAARTHTEQAQRQLRTAESGLEALRATDTPDPRRIDRAELQVARARVELASAEFEQAAARLRADAHQRRADEFQSRADESQRRADLYQLRADDLRMVRVDPDVINRGADAEAKPTVRPIGTEHSWWQRALLRSEQVGKEYGSGGPGTDHYQAKGTDLRAKTRPKLERYHQPEIAPYTAPAAPDPSAWGLPPYLDNSAEPADTEHPEDPEGPEDAEDPECTR